jgi:N6-adenosine-specific RNA methylase IME4
MSELPAIPKPGTAIAASRLEQLERETAAALAEITDVDVLEEARLRASALEHYLRGRGLQGPMLGTQRRIEARIGQLLGEPKPGARTDLQPPNRASEVVYHDPDRQAFRLLARALAGELELDPDGWRRSRRTLVAHVRRELGLRPSTPALPPGVFRCIVADPPWQLETGPDAWGTTGERGHDHLDYDQMSIDEIRELDVAATAADDAHLYLWTTCRYLEAAYDVARAWGFRPSVPLTWCKTPRGVGLGDTFRQTTEFVLFARRGSLEALRIVPTTWFEWPRGRHSAKPAAFFELVESVTPARGKRDRLELFARAPRPGWTTWGDELGEEVAA